ncbi:MAG: hypothetical protein ACOYZ8_08420 [Chloroflexota bacterium]
MPKRITLTICLLLLLSACSPQATPTVALNEVEGPATDASSTLSAPPATATASPVPSSSPTPSPTNTPAPTDTPTVTPIPTVESLKAHVTADLLSCRYGPGAEYLYLYGLRGGANIVLVGRTDGNNWVWVEGKNKCWVNAKFIEIEGDKNSLPIVYPDIAKLPVSPYYPPTVVLSAAREQNLVTVRWLEVPISAGDYEDETMFTYIVEVWRCEGGQMIFDPLATNEAAISFVDEAGCLQPSHGRVFVQEKHGFAGPAKIPWP